MNEKDVNSLFQLGDLKLFETDNSSFDRELWDNQIDWLVTSKDLKDVSLDLKWDSELDVLQDYAGAEDLLDAVPIQDQKPDKPLPAPMAPKYTAPKQTQQQTQPVPWPYTSQASTSPFAHMGYQDGRAAKYPAQGNLQSPVKSYANSNAAQQQNMDGFGQRYANRTPPPKTDEATGKKSTGLMLAFVAIMYIVNLNKGLRQGSFMYMQQILVMVIALRSAYSSIKYMRQTQNAKGMPLIALVIAMFAMVIIIMYFAMSFA